MAGIRLEWAQFGDFDSFDVIRSDTSLANIADDDLPSAIATNLKTMYYVDTSVELDNTYYYKVRAWRNDAGVVSSEIKCIASLNDDWLFNLIPSNNKLIDTKNILTLTGSGQVIDNYFNGVMTSATNLAWGWYGKQGYLEFEVKGSGNIANDWGNNVRFMLWIENNICYLQFYLSSPFGSNTISFPVNEAATKFIKVRIIRNSDGSFSATVDGSNVEISGNKAFSFNIYAPADNVPIGSNSLFIKYLRHFSS